MTSAAAERYKRNKESREAKADKPIRSTPVATRTAPKSKVPPVQSAAKEAKKQIRYVQTNPRYEALMRLSERLNPVKYGLAKATQGAIGDTVGEAAKSVAILSDTIGDYFRDDKDAASTRPEDSRLYKFGQKFSSRGADTAIQRAYDPKKKLEGSVYGQAARTAGQLAGTVVTGAAGRAVRAATAAGAGAGRLYEEAKESGATDATAKIASGAGAALGLTELLPLTRALGRAAKYVPPSVRAGLSRIIGSGVKQVATSAAEEGLQEAGQQLGQNVAAKTLYDKDRSLTQNVPESAAAGAIAGGMFSSLAHLLSSQPRAQARQQERVEAPDDVIEGEYRVAQPSDSTDIVRTAQDVKRTLYEAMGLDKVQVRPDRRGTRARDEMVADIRQRLSTGEMTRPEAEAKITELENRFAQPVEQSDDVVRPRSMTSRRVTQPWYDDTLDDITAQEPNVADKQEWQERVDDFRKSVVIFAKGDTYHAQDGSTIPESDVRQLNEVANVEVQPLDASERQDAIRQTVEALNTQIEQEVSSRDPRDMADLRYIDATERAFGVSPTGIKKLGGPQHKANWLIKHAQELGLEQSDLDQLIDISPNGRPSAKPIATWPANARQAWSSRLGEYGQERGIESPYPLSGMSTSAGDYELQMLGEAQAILNNLSQGKYTGPRKDAIGRELNRTITNLASGIHDMTGGKWRVQLRMEDSGVQPRVEVVRSQLQGKVPPVRPQPQIQELSFPNQPTQYEQGLASAEEEFPTDTPRVTIEVVDTQTGQPVSQEEIQEVVQSSPSNATNPQEEVISPELKKQYGITNERWKRVERGEASPRMAIGLAGMAAATLLGGWEGSYLAGSEDENNDFLRYDADTQQFSGWLADATASEVERLSDEYEKESLFWWSMNALGDIAGWAQWAAGVAYANSTGQTAGKTPEEKRAMWEAAANLYSGTEAVDATTKAILALGPNPSREQITEAVNTNKDQVRDFIGTLLLDPLNFIAPTKLISGGGKTLQQTRMWNRAVTAMNLADKTEGWRLWNLLNSFGEMWRTPESKVALASNQAAMRVWAEIADATDAMEAIGRFENYLARPTIAGEGVQFTADLRANLSRYVEKLKTQVTADPSGSMSAESAAQLIRTLVRDSVKKEAEKQFGKTTITGSPLLWAGQQWGNIQRKTLGWALLKLNPGFSITNRIGNKMSQFFDGAVSIKSEPAMNKWWQANVGLVPDFAKTGASALGVGTGEGLIEKIVPSQAVAILPDEALASYQSYTSAFMGWFPQLFQMRADEVAKSVTGLNPNQVKSLVRSMGDVWNEQQMLDELVEWSTREGVSPAVSRQLQQVLQPELVRSRMGAMAAADQLRNFTLLNYSDRNMLDTALDVVVSPFHYWSTRSVFNWLQRMADNPGIPALYAKMNDALLNEWNKDSQDADYLKRQFSMAVGPIRRDIQSLPWVPDDFLTTGLSDTDNLYFNFMSKLMPIEQIYSFMPGTGYEPPLDKEAAEQPVNQFLNYLEDVPGGINPFLMSTIALVDAYGEDLGLERERFEVTAPLAIARPIKGLSAIARDAGVEGIPAGGYDISALYRPLLGYDSKPAYEVKRTMRFLADSVKDGSISQEDAMEAIRTGEGPIWDRAVQQAGRLYGDRGLLSYGTSILASSEPHNELRLENEARTKLLQSLGMQAGVDGPMTVKGARAAVRAGTASPEQVALAEAANNWEETHPQRAIASLSYQKPSEAREYATERVAWDSGSDYIRQQAGYANPQVKSAIDAMHTGTATPEQYKQVADSLSSASRTPADRMRQSIEANIETTINRQFPNYKSLSTQYFSLGTKEAKRSFLEAHPELKAAWAVREQMKQSSGLFPVSREQRAEELKKYPVSPKQADYARSIGVNPANMTSFEVNEAIDNRMAQAAKRAGLTPEQADALSAKWKARAPGEYLPENEYQALKRYWDALYGPKQKTNTRRRSR